MRTWTWPLVLAGTLCLCGCAASIAASAVGAAVRAGRGERAPVNAGAATEACVAHASKLGQVAVIDAEQRGAGKVVVWGTVQDARERRSFECSYTGKVSGFRLRAIRAG